MDDLIPYLPLLIPILLIVIALWVICLTDLSRREPERVRGPKWMWVPIILFIQIFGALAYLIFGRLEE